MGALKSIKKQFIDVIDWTDDDASTLVYRYPMLDREIQTGAQLTVREGQMAVFINEGQIADVFGPGRFKLTTKTLPVLTALRNWDKLFTSPFKSDVYFVSARHNTEQKWGTQTPLTVRDPEFGAIRLRANGIYSFSIDDAGKVVTKLSGALERYTTDDIAGQLRSMIVTTMASFLGTVKVPFIDMAANQAKFSKMIEQALTKSFSDYGFKLNSFYVQSITLPEDLHKYLDRAASMRMVGDLEKYAQFQTADSIKDAANNSSGVAGAGAAIGAGAAMGQAMLQSMSPAPAKANASDTIATIQKLHDLRKTGAITDGEFEAKKAELLKKIS